MRRSRALLTLACAAALGGCRGTSALPGGGDAGTAVDVGPALPDAHVAKPADAGPGDMIPMPTLLRVSPSSGSEVGGTRVVLRGTSFIEPAQVFFDGIAAGEVTVLDPVSIGATTPPHAPGAVTVKVMTTGGIAELPSGFTYERELQIDAVMPPRLPDVGGVQVTVVGKGFNADTIVLFGRKPLAGLTLVDAEHMTGYSPALSPGRPEVRALHKEASTSRGDLVVVYGTPRPNRVTPGYGPITGRVPQTIEGAGFEGAQNARFGSATSSVSLLSGSKITAGAPALSAGVYDVTVANMDASGTLPRGYIAYDPAVATFKVLGITPPAASSAGGSAATIVGSGFPPDAKVMVGSATAAVTAIGAHAIKIVVPGGLAVGMEDVKVRSAMLGSTATSPVGLRIYAPIVVTGIDPSGGPTSGGTAVSITGSGFVDGADVRIADIPLSEVHVMSGTLIQGKTVAGPYGPQEVLVRTADTQGVLHNGFTFDEAFEIIRIDPVEGSIAGNTYVSVFGRGLEAPVAVKFGPKAGINALLENGSILGVRTASEAVGVVDVDVSTGRGSVSLPQAFTFYDPKLITGGAWGGPIEGSVNVAVLDINSGMGIPGTVVQLGYDADIRYANITDANGLATVSTPDLRGPVTVTAGQTNVEFVTFMDFDAKNLTIYASPYPQSMPPNAPVQPCPTPQSPPVITGHVFGVKSALDPVTHPGFEPVVRVTYSQPNVFQANPPTPPEQEMDFIAAEGAQYQIVVVRPGTIAVYAILGDFNMSTQEFINRRMGIARQIPVPPPGQTSAPVDITLDIELDKDLTIRLADPPLQVPGPTLDAVFPFLNLRSDGVIPLNPTAVFSNEVTLHQMPSIAASDLFYMGGSFTQGQMGNLGAPYSLSLLESGTPFEQGLDLGPFLQMPANADPKPNAVIHHGSFSWDQGGVRPDIATISVVDIKGVSGCCCVDVNMDGACESGEPKQCGGGPVQYARWSIYGPGGLDLYAMPRMPFGLQAFDNPASYFWEVQEAVAPRFNYHEFIYNEFSPFFWTSWNVWFSTFISKEQTD